MRRSRPSSAQIRSPPLFEFTPPLALSPAEQPFRQTRLGGSWVTESETEVWSKAWSDASASRLPRPASAAPRSCANALPLWREVLRATRACCGDVWPALLVPLRGGVRAAKAASDAAAEAEFGAELERVLAVLRPACDDVA